MQLSDHLLLYPDDEPGDEDGIGLLPVTTIVKPDGDGQVKP
jgi:hypothetical protein